MIRSGPVKTQNENCCKKSDGYLIRVKNSKIEILCRQCRKPTQPYGSGRTISLRHLPLCGKKVTIEITPLRSQCLNCEGNPTTTQQADWYDAKSPCTKAYEKHILLSLINRALLPNPIHIVFNGGF